MMKILNYLKRKQSYVLIIALTIIYLLFLSINPVSDAYSYAYSSLWGEDMFRPHHLLYCLWGRIILRLFAFTAIEPITLLQISNALVAGGCLLILRRIIKRINREEKFITSSVLFCGACFGFVRFATDNECYMVPLFLTLLAIYYVQIFLIRNTYSRLLKASVSLVFACLFHQLAIIVWLPVAVLILLNRNKKYILSFFAVSLVIPLVYALSVCVISGDVSLVSTIKFALTDYINGTAQMPQLKQVLMLSIVSLVRTFIQVHGYMFEFAKDNLAVSIVVCALVLFLFVFGVIAFIKDKHNTLKLFHERLFVRFIWVLLVATFAFAAFSNGNAEFMTLIPFLIVMLHAYYFNSFKPVFSFGIAIFLWNMTFALYPLGRIKMTPQEDIALLSRKYENAVFVLRNKNMVENICLYKWGKDLNITLKHAHKYTEEQYILDKNEGKIIITDVIDGEESLNRASLTEQIEFGFENVQKRKILLRFSSPMCKRIVCEVVD